MNSGINQKSVKQPNADTGISYWTSAIIEYFDIEQLLQVHDLQDIVNFETFIHRNILLRQ